MTSVQPYTSRNREDPLNYAPRVTWDQLYSYLKGQFRQGDHVSILGPTETGKTHIALTVAELRTYVMVIATKPRDPLVEDVLSRGYHRVSTTELQKGVDYVDGRPLHPRMVYWPQLTDAQVRRIPESQRIRARKKFQKPLVQGALGYVDLNGHWCVVLDEGTWIYKDLRLQEDIDSALTQWRTNKASVIVLGQRPAWMGRYVLSQPTHVFLFHTSNIEDAKSLGNISGVNTKLVREIVLRLSRDEHEFLYYCARTGDMFRSVAPPR